MAAAGADTIVLDLNGVTVLPGLIDGHVHLGSGLSLMRGVNLYGIADRQEWFDMIAAKASELPPGTWIVGGRWDHTLAPGAPPEEADHVDVAFQLPDATEYLSAARDIPCIIVVKRNDMIKSLILNIL